MQAKSQVAIAFAPESSEEGTIYSPITEPEEFTQTAATITTDVKVKPRETKGDFLAASVVYGFTASFMAFIFGLVTEYIPSAFENILLSLFMGICVGVIAYGLMSGED